SQDREGPPPRNSRQAARARRRGDRVRRREFITLLGGAAVAWPLGARGQQAPTPRIGYLSGRSPQAEAPLLAAVRHGPGGGGLRRKSECRDRISVLWGTR